MALFQKLQRTVCKLTRPVVQKANTTELAQSEEDEETCDYAVALQNCLIGHANEVYGVADPRDISGIEEAMRNHFGFDIPDCIEAP